MASFSPVHTVGDQIIEAIRLHVRLDGGAARARAIELLDRSACRSRSTGSTNIRTS